MAAGWQKFSNHSPYPVISSNDNHSSFCYGPKRDRSYRIHWVCKNDENEQQATIEWVAEMIGEQQVPNTLIEIGDWLQNGVVICKLFEELYPGELLRPINEKKSQLSALENITNFLLSAEKSGFLEADLFELSDLQAHKNIPRVIQTLSALRKKVCMCVYIANRFY
uniref:Calponin-homology (CH) domain-containing protein n=1 Tax=Syphacia muris TaxID=451379 RepID=A0A0N5AYD4_9BILA